MVGEQVVNQLEEVLQNVKKLKEESNTNARYWLIVYTKLEDVLVRVKTYCVEEEE